MTKIISRVGAYTIKTGPSPEPNRHLGFWESSANIEGEPEEDDDGELRDTTIYGYLDHCNGSREQAEAMHIEMLTLAVTQP